MNLDRDRCSMYMTQFKATAEALDSLAKEWRHATDAELVRRAWAAGGSISPLYANNDAFKGLPPEAWFEGRSQDQDRARGGF